MRRRCGRCQPNATPFGFWKTAKVHIDYHVEFEAHYYSVPHRLVGAKIDVRVTGQLLECFASNQRVAGHAVSTVRGGFTTTPEHMPASHRAHLDWTPAKLIAWRAAHRREHRRGGHLAARAPTASRAGLPRLPGPAGARAPLLERQRLEAACTRAMAIRAPTCAASPTSSSAVWIASPRCLPADGTAPLIEHDNVRGPDYYH